MGVGVLLQYNQPTGSTTKYLDRYQVLPILGLGERGLVDVPDNIRSEQLT